MAHLSHADLAELEAQAAAERHELSELYDLFGADRVSNVPVGLYVKFEVSRENRDKAALARLQREERDRIRQEKAQQLHEATQARRAKVRTASGKSARDLLNENGEIMEMLEDVKREQFRWRDQLQVSTGARASV